jgi:hypothetical protein
MIADAKGKGIKHLKQLDLACEFVNGHGHFGHLSCFLLLFLVAEAYFGMWAKKFWLSVFQYIL